MGTTYRTQSISRNAEEIPCRDALEKFLDHLSAVEGKSPNTIKAYRRDLTDFLVYMRDRKSLPKIAGPERILQVDITDYLAHLGKRRQIREGGRIREGKLSARTQNRRLSALKAFFRFCVEYRLVRIDPTAELRGAQGSKKLPVFLTIEEVVKLIDSIPGGDLAGLRDRAIVECLYSTGLRVSELVGLGCGDIPRTGNSMRVIGKRRKERIVFLGEPAMRAISAYLHQRRAEGFDSKPDSPLFANKNGGRLTSRSVQRMLSYRARKAGLRVIPTPHSLRHSFATHLVQGGADLRTVQELLGHARLGTVQIYTHLSLKDLRERYLAAHPLAIDEIPDGK